VTLVGIIGNSPLMEYIVNGILLSKLVTNTVKLDHVMIQVTLMETTNVTSVKILTT
jgi:hypothetical protein